jgi:hypothetical protein
MLARRSLALLPLVPLSARAEGARFVMLDRADCPFCRRWHAEVGERAWNRSSLGQVAPLRRVDTARPLPPDLAALPDLRITPTFLLLAGGAERGRFLGYQGATLFWQQAEALLARLTPTG